MKKSVILLVIVLILASVAYAQVPPPPPPTPSFDDVDLTEEPEETEEGIEEATTIEDEPVEEFEVTDLPPQPLPPSQPIEPAPIVIDEPPTPKPFDEPIPQPIDVEAEETGQILLVTIGLVAALAIGIIVIIILYKRHNKASPQLKSYIQQARLSRMQDSQIRTTLLQQGWTAKQIDSAYNALQKK